MLGFGQLTAGVLSGEDDAGFLRDAAGGFAAVLLDEGGRLLPFQSREGAGEHKGHAGEADIRPLGFAGHIDPRQPQLFNKMPGLGEGEKVHGAFRHNAAEAVDGGDVFGAGAQDGLHGAEPFRQQFGRFLADVADPQGKDHPEQIAFLGFFNGRQQIVGRFLPHSLQRFHGFPIEAVQFVGIADQPVVHQLLEHRGAESLDIHGVPRGKMDEIAQLLRRAFRIGAAQRRLILFPGDLRAAGGADMRHLVDGSALLVRHHPHHLGDDISGLAQHHPIADGQLPSNVKAGYVIRRILRRAVRYGYTYLGFTEPTLCRLVPGLVGQMGGQFPELKAQQGLIEKVIEEEESSFLRTLATGINLLDGVISRTKGEGKELISGKDAFELYDTFGFPIDLTELIAREQGVGVDLAAFEKELQAQKERSRNAAAVDTDDWVELFPIRESIFTGYDTLTEKVRIARYRRVTSKGKTSYQLVFDRTPFYGNSGGQVGDIGMIESANERIPVVATEKENGLIIHIVNQLPENPAAEFTARVDPEKRQAAANNHTATHLMHEALRKVLGAHVEQKGSLVTPEILRFDFSHFQKVTPEELRKVEQLVNRAIRANYPLVENREATKEEAEKCGAMMLFGEKYGDKVRMVRFGSSVELCGGTHTGATGNIGFFKILSESAISAGVRRIEAVTGEQAEKVLYAAEDTMRNIAEYLNNPQVVQAVKKMLESNETLSKEVESMRREQVAQWADKIAASTPERHGMQLFATQTDRRPDFVKDLAYNLRQRSPRLVFVVGSVWDGKPTLTVMLGDEITACGVNAGAVVREAAKLMQGGGGGQAFFATAGGKNPDGLQAAIDKAVELIGAQVK